LTFLIFTFVITFYNYGLTAFFDEKDIDFMKNRGFIMFFAISFGVTLLMSCDKQDIVVIDNYTVYFNSNGGSYVPPHINR